MGGWLAGSGWLVVFGKWLVDGLVVGLGLGDTAGWQVVLGLRYMHVQSRMVHYVQDLEYRLGYDVSCECKFHESTLYGFVCILDVLQLMCQ